MAFGISRPQRQFISSDGLTAEQFLTLAVETARKLGWRIDYLGQGGFIAYTNYGEEAWNANIKFILKDEGAVMICASAAGGYADSKKNKQNIELFVSTLQEVRAVLSDQDLHARYEELRAAFPLPQDSKDAELLADDPRSFSLGALFIPRKGYFITPLLVDLNIIIFLFMVLGGVDFMQPKVEDLLLWGANFRPSTLAGESWRLLTSCFLHIGVLHLALNMYALIYIGLLLEPVLGRSRFLAAYLLTGLLSSTASLWWNELTVSAGASGAIFGMYGVFLALLTTSIIPKDIRGSLLSSIGIFVAYNLLYGLKGNGIDNAAHIGGLLSGLCIGYTFYFVLRRQASRNLNQLTIGSLTMLTALIIVFTTKSIPNDIGTYQNRMSEFSRLEEEALGIYRMPDTTPREALLSEVKDHGIADWNKALSLLKELDKLELPDEIHHRNALLEHYCELRIKSFELIYKAIAENTNIYDTGIGDYTKEIEKLIGQLGGEQK